MQQCQNWVRMNRTRFPRLSSCVSVFKKSIINVLDSVRDILYYIGQYKDFGFYMKDIHRHKFAKYMQLENKISTNLGSKNIDPISFFEKDTDFAFVYKKTEKLASAVYMITNLFSENEPMKWTLRKKVSELVSFTVNYKDTSESTRVDFINLIKTKVLEMVSMLEISLNGGLISQMNFSILKQEFSRVVETLDSTSFEPKNLFNKSIPESFFEVPEVQKLTIETSKYPQNYTTPESEIFVKRTLNEELKDKNQILSKENFKRSNRQNVILSLIRKKKELTIKDIAEVIKDCSEKTIQRELNSFIRIGALKRTGVRRWSKYSLA